MSTEVIIINRSVVVLIALFVNFCVGVVCLTLVAEYVPSHRILLIYVIIGILVVGYAIAINSNAAFKKWHKNFAKKGP